MKYVHLQDSGHSTKSVLYTHAPLCICGFEESDTVNWCMVVHIHRMCTETAAVPRVTSHVNKSAVTT